MAWFSKPKVAEVAAHASTPDEEARAQKAMWDKYPQMRDADWGKPKVAKKVKPVPAAAAVPEAKPAAKPKRETALSRMKDAANAEDASLEEALSPEELAKFGYSRRK